MPKRYFSSSRYVLKNGISPEGTSVNYRISLVRLERAAKITGHALEAAELLPKTLREPELCRRVVIPASLAPAERIESGIQGIVIARHFDYSYDRHGRECVSQKDSIFLAMADDELFVFDWRWFENGELDFIGATV